MQFAQDNHLNYLHLVDLAIIFLFRSKFQLVNVSPFSTIFVQISTWKGAESVTTSNSILRSNLFLGELDVLCICFKLFQVYCFIACSPLYSKTILDRLFRVFGIAE